MQVPPSRIGPLDQSELPLALPLLYLFLSERYLPCVRLGSSSVPLASTLLCGLLRILWRFLYHSPLRWFRPLHRKNACRALLNTKNPVQHRNHSFRSGICLLEFANREVESTTLVHDSMSSTAFRKSRYYAVISTGAMRSIAQRRNLFL